MNATIRIVALSLAISCGIYIVYADSSNDSVRLAPARPICDVLIGLRLRGGRKGVSAKHTTAEIARKTV
jgi:hypothetical protein